MSEELIKVVNFDGFINHVSNSGEGSEVIIYVSHVISDDSRITQKANEKDETVAQNLFDDGRTPVSNNDNDYGEVFTIRVGQCIERVAAKNISENERLTKVHLIDKGIDVEVERSALFPSTSQGKLDINCMCPVLVVDAGEEQRKVAAQITGRECRCINGNLVVIPSVGLCVKGRLLISYENGGYAELKDISLVPAAGQEYTKFVMEEGVSQLNGDILSSSERERPFRYRFNPVSRSRRNFGGRYARRNEDNDTVETYRNDACIFNDNHNTNPWNDNQSYEDSEITGNNVSYNSRHCRGNLSDASFDYGNREEVDETHATIPRHDMPYKQHAFKDYMPHFYPRSIRIRFDKFDSPPTNTFWAFEPNVFTSIERILHEGRLRYTTCPQFDMSVIHALNGIGCLVRASVDSGCRSLCRAEIIRFAENTHKFSVYLVDYGFYKWVKYNDVFDISEIDKKDKVLLSPVALLHCRLERNSGNGIRLQQLEKGAEYEITIKSRDSEGIFTVRIDRFDDRMGALSNIRGSLVPNNSGAMQNDLLAPWCSFSSLQYSNDTLAKAFERNISIGEAMRSNALMNTMMANNMPFNNWTNFCGFGIACPVIMPLMMPMMPNFGNVTKNGQTNRTCENFGPGDDAENGDPMMNRNMHNGNNRGHEEGGYRSFECNEEPNYRDDFGRHGDTQARFNFDRFDKRNNNRWGGGGERGGWNRGRRPGKRSPRINLSGDDAEQGSYRYDGPGFTFSRKESKNRRERFACSGSSEWDLPPPRNHHVNCFTDFDTENAPTGMNPK